MSGHDMCDFVTEDSRQLVLIFRHVEQTGLDEVDDLGRTADRLGVELSITDHP